MFCACLTISGHTHWKKSRQKPRDIWKNAESVHSHRWVGKCSKFWKVHKHGQPTSEAWLMSCARGIGAKNVNPRRMITSFAGGLVRLVPHIPAPRFLQTRLSMSGCFAMLSVHLIRGISILLWNKKDHLDLFKGTPIFYSSSSLEYRPSLFLAVRLLLFHLPSSRSRSLKKLQASQTSRSMVSKYVPGWLAEPPAHWEKSYRHLGEESSQKSGGNPNQKKKDALKPPTSFGLQGCAYSAERFRRWWSRCAPHRSLERDPWSFQCASPAPHAVSILTLGPRSVRRNLLRSVWGRHFRYLHCK